jgi:hypothetical protein
LIRLIYLLSPALSFSIVIILPNKQPRPRPVSVQLWFELERPEGLNLSFPAYMEPARSEVAVKDDDEGVTA